MPEDTARSPKPFRDSLPSKAVADDIALSKFLSYVLRHAPERAGLTLDAAGWASVPDVLRAARLQGLDLDRAALERVVETSDKQRFALEGDRIRANQGHSVPVDLGLEAVAPPVLLYHGTARRFLVSILAEGLNPGRRHHVHLSGDVATATAVGQRRGEPVVLTVQARALAEAGPPFYRSANGVWLVDHVPPGFLSPPDRS